MRVFFTNLGCKLNQAELEHLAREFRGAGHRIARSLSAADLHVVNTCTVTGAAARDSRKAARRGRRVNPKLRTVLTGCHATAAPEEAARLRGVDLVVPNGDKHRLLELVHEAFPWALPEARREPVPVPYVPLEFGNSRAAVKVEDGCNMRCAFCIIPLTRGRQRSRPPGEVLAEVRGLVGAGFREVALTGVQISSYRSGGHRLYDLVRAILDGTDVPRLRLTSIAPWDLDERLLELAGSGRLCRHFHLSLQSGCDATLRRMRRPYTAAGYAATAAGIRRAIPGVAITTDVIVGFPGETEREFEDSLSFAAEMGFARIHAFPFSPRPGTAAAAMAGRVPPEVRRRRMDRFLEVAAAAERRFWESRVGEAAEVLWERHREGLWRGTTDHYIRVLWPGSGEEDLAGRLGRARLERITPGGVLATLPCPAPEGLPRASAPPGAAELPAVGAADPGAGR